MRPDDDDDKTNTGGRIGTSGEIRSHEREEREERIREGKALEAEIERKREELERRQRGE